jgi:hypothetical protein
MRHVAATPGARFNPELLQVQTRILRRSLVKTLENSRFRRRHRTRQHLHTFECDKTELRFSDLVGLEDRTFARSEVAILGTQP